MYETFEQISQLITEKLKDEILSISIAKVDDFPGVVYEVRIRIKE